MARNLINPNQIHNIPTESVFLFAASLYLFAVHVRFFFLPRVFFRFAARFFFLPRGFSFCCEVFPFAASLFLFATRFFFLPRVFSFCREVFCFALGLFFLP